MLPVLFFLIAAPASAQRLPETVMPSHYDLTFVVDLDRARFEGTETIRATVAEPTARIVLNAVDIDFHDVTIGAGASQQKAAVSLDAKTEMAALSVPKPIAT